MSGAVIRRLLLLMLVIGIAGMHTLGHPEPGHGGHGVTVAGHVWDGPENAPPRAGDALALRQAPDEAPPGLDPTTVCLAILTGLLLFLGAAAALCARRPAV